MEMVLLCKYTLCCIYRWKLVQSMRARERVCVREFGIEFLCSIHVDVGVTYTL